MKPNQTISNRWHTAATYAAALCLLIAPFRGSTGWRAALLVLALIFMLMAAKYRRQALWTMPAHASVFYAVSAWALALLVGCLASPEQWHQLNSWKGEVLTPLLALPVFFALTKNHRDARRWLLVLATGLIGLTSLAILNQFDPVDAMTMPAFGGIGPYSTWLVTLCPLLVLAWRLSPARDDARNNAGDAMPDTTLQLPRKIHACVLAAVVLILVSAYLTANRAIWVCFALMLLVYAGLSIMLAGPQRRYLGQWAALVLVGSMVFIGLFIAATEQRFNGKPPGGGGTIEMVTHDNRGVIWREAIALVAEKPFTGYGYGRDVLEKTMSGRFTEPLDKALFIQGHNLVLNQVLQIGVVGAVLILAVFMSLIHAFSNMLRGPALARTAGLCGLILVVGVFTRNMVDDFFIRQNAILFWAIVGMLLGLGLKLGKDQVKLNSTDKSA